ncbi:MAG: serine hydroxymethyltransferase [Coriobacteriales bacterium]|jgi:glycine hydroxymethyltransferase
MSHTHLTQTDPEIAKAIDDELSRQRGTIELIASENITSLSVMEAMGSVLTNKYAEGYPGKRYYGGCEYVDVVESIARSRVIELFGAKYANVQPHSGAQANQAAYQALLKPGDKILGMSLDAGGHLSHGAKFNLSGKFYESHFYGIDEKTERLDMDAVRAIALEVKPKLIVAGASAYPRIIDFKAFGDIAREVGAYLVVDMAHIAGLVAGGVHPSPVPYADLVTSTSHKTLRGPRGGFMVTNNEEAYKKYNKAVFPGCQGGPLMHVIAGKAVAFGEALKPSFKEYAKNVVDNARAMGEGLVEGGLRLVSGGTDNHLCLVDLTPSGVTGADAEVLLESVGITTNKNAIPNDPQPTTITSGIRVGSPAMTTRGFNAEEAHLVGTLIADALNAHGDEDKLAAVKGQVNELLDAHPLYPEL